jgi:hypothetical protein
VWSSGPSLLADVTSDGVLDRIDLIPYQVVVQPGRGDGTFSDPIRSFAPYAYALGVADFNGDSRLDAFTLNFPPNWWDGGSWGSVLWGGGDGNFYYAGEDYGFPYGTPLVVGFGDIYASGRTDVVVALEWGEYNYVYAVLRNNLGPVTPGLSIYNATVTEGNAGAVAATFTVRLSVANSEAITVDYATADGTATDGSDYQAASGMLTFAPGETEKTITVQVNGDRLAEPNETFIVNLSGATNAAILDGQGGGTIVDDEPRISISDVSKKEGKKNNTTLFTFTVTLSAAYDQAVTMSFQTVNGTAKTSNNDYVAKAGTLTFAPGQTSKSITIEVKGDSKREGNETFYVDLTGLSSNALFTKSRGIGTILNDD